MSGRRQKIRPEKEVLAFTVERRSDAPRATEEGTETLMAKRTSESLAGTERLMQEVCELGNWQQALQRVKANKGSPGVDGMTVDELPEYLKQHGARNRGTAAERDLPTATGETGGNRETGRRWNAQAWHSHCLGPFRPTGSVAGSAETLEPDVLRTQPR